METAVTTKDAKAQRRVAVVYPFLYHFREPILQLLCRQVYPAPEYTLFSGTVSNVPALELIDPARASVSPAEGGLRWRFLKNLWLGKNVLWQRGLLRVVATREFDTIIFYGFRSHLTTWLAAMLARLQGKRVLIWTHGVYHDEGGPRKWYKYAFLKLAHGILLFGYRARNILVTWGFAGRNLYLVYNSLDYDRQVANRDHIAPETREETRRALFGHPDWPVLFFVGRIVARKRLDLLIEAGKMLTTRGLPVNILIVGDGPEVAELKERTRQLDLEDQVVFYGPCHREEELGRLISSSDICVCPAALGLTAVHSLVYGTPVITHDQPELHGPEFEAIVPGENGMLFQKDDASDLARVIELWCLERRTCEDTGSACKRIVDEFYNPHLQLRVINAAVEAIDANELPIRGE